jgi:hypothetical protein
MSPSVDAESERMSGTDAAWLHMDRDDNPMVVNILLHFDNCPDWTAVEAAFIERIVDRYPRFRARAVESDNILFSPRWVIEERFDPRSHFVHVDLEGPKTDVAEALHVTSVSRPLCHWTATGRCGSCTTSVCPAVEALRCCAPTTRWPMAPPCRTC